MITIFQNCFKQWKRLIWWVQYCHRNQCACSGLEMSPVCTVWCWAEIRPCGVRADVSNRRANGSKSICTTCRGLAVQQPSLLMVRAIFYGCRWLSAPFLCAFQTSRQIHCKSKTRDGTILVISCIKVFVGRDIVNCRLKSRIGWFLGRAIIHSYLLSKFCCLSSRRPGT